MRAGSGSDDAEAAEATGARRTDMAARRLEMTPSSAPQTKEAKTPIATQIQGVDSRPPKAPVPAASGLVVSAAVSAPTVWGPLPAGT